MPSFSLAALTALELPPSQLVEVASACGFADANHLCKVFKRHYHVSPGKWRAEFG